MGVAWKHLLAAGALGTVISACGGASGALDLETVERDQWFETLTTTDRGTTLESGLRILAIERGDGKTPELGQYVCAHYDGRHANGDMFDSSFERDLPFAHPSDQLIKGWIEALQLMKGGDEWALEIPPDIAYGAQGRGPIAPNETLYFRVRLIGVLDGPVPEGDDCTDDIL